jgi:hypothetical protein
LGRLAGQGDCLHCPQDFSRDEMVRAFAHGRVDVARAADDDAMGEAEIDQSTEAFGACIRRADDTEPAEEVRWDNLSLVGVLEPMVVVVVAARDLLDNGGISARQRRHYVALEMCRDARVPPDELVERPLIGSRPHHNKGADIVNVSNVVGLVSLLPQESLS